MAMPTKLEPYVIGRYVERALRTVAFIDIVESVRLIDTDEHGVICRWLTIVDATKSVVLPKFGGRFVKSLGDGMLLEFAEPRAAVEACLEIHRISREANAGYEPDLQLQLRAGIEVSEVIIEPDDIFGRGVNLAARLMTLAAPGDTIVSADVRDQLTDAVDGEIEDLGECYMKHLATPVRAFRLRPVGSTPAQRPLARLLRLRPTIAVIPFLPRRMSSGQAGIGDILAEEIILKLARWPELSVISRNSTSTLRARLMTADEIGKLLSADYVLSGTFQSDAESLRVHAELAEARTNQIVWTERLSGKVVELCEDDQPIIENIVEVVSRTILNCETRKVRTHSLPTLQGYTLLLSAVGLMHRLSPQDFWEARAILEHLIDRGRRQAVPHAWLAQWYVLRVIQGWSDDVKADTIAAMNASARALEADDTSSQALAIDAFAHVHLLRRFDIAAERFKSALELKPNDALALLLRGTMYAFSDRGEQAVADCKAALALSPLDPQRFIFDAHYAGAHLTAGNYEEAERLAERSFRANSCHGSTLRIMTVAKWQLGKRDEARKFVEKLMTLDPTLTTKGYLSRAPSAQFEIGQLVARTLGEAGVPD